MRSYKKAAEHPTPLTAKADKSPIPDRERGKAAPSGSSGGEGVGVFTEKSSGELPRATRPNWAVLSQQPGHCGSCQRFTPSPDWGPYMGECGTVSRAWWPDSAPLSIHMAHACPLEGAQGYRAMTL